MSDASEEILLRGAAQGDRTAFGKLSQLHRERIQTYLESMVPEGTVAEDLTQETLARAFEGLGKFEGKCKFSTWLFQIAVNLARDYFKRRSTREKKQSTPKLDGLPRRSRARTVLSKIVQQEQADRLSGAIEDLPPTFREAFVLRLVEGIEYPEIAQILGTSVNTVRIRVHRAKLLLQEELRGAVDTILAQKGEAEME